MICKDHWDMRLLIDTNIFIFYATDQQMPLISDDNRFPEYRKEGLELIEN